MTASSGISSWQSTASRRHGSSTAPSSAFAPGATTISFSPLASTRISATPVGASAAASVELDPGLAQPGERLVGEGVVARRSRPAALARRGARRRPPGSRPCRRGRARTSRPVTVSPGRGSRSQRATRSRLTEPTTRDARSTAPSYGLSPPAERPGGPTRRARAGRRRVGRAGSRAGRTGPPRARRGRARARARAASASPSSARTSTASSR